MIRIQNETDEILKPQEGAASFQVMVSIVIIASEDAHYIRECFSSIRDHTPESHEIVFVSEGLSNEQKNRLQMLVKGKHNCRLVSGNGNPGYAQACNLGISESSGEYIVLLNDDVIVTEGWLSGMLECIKSAGDTGIVGPMTVNIDGPQGVKKIVTPLPAAHNDKAIAEFAKAFRSKNRHRRINNRKLLAFCMLFSRNLLKQIGLFDEQFTTQEYATDDYCLRSATEGFRNIISGDVFVHSNGDQNFRDIVILKDRSIAHNKLLFTDRKLFIDKWSSKGNNELTGKKLFTLNALRLADELSQQGKKDSAVIALLEGLRSSPDDKNLHYALAELLIGNRNYKDALDILEKMPVELRKDAKKLELTGYCKEGLNVYEEAERCANEAISIDDASPKTWNLKGLLAYKAGRLVDAEKYFYKALESDRSMGESYANLGAIKWSAGDGKEALNLFERGFILSPTVEEIVLNYHAVSVSLSQQLRAEEVFGDAATFYPSSRQLKYVLVDLLLQNEKYHEAMKCIEEALLSFGIDNDSLSLALGIREKTGPKEIRTLEASNPAAISLCMIVKNEEKNIGACLHSIAPLVDEMIVVDTGSTDRTKDIAQAFGAKVYDFPWKNDFSEARNVSLSKASGAWILTLDADEVIVPLDQKFLRMLVKKPEFRSTAFSITTKNYVVPVSSLGWKANDGSYIKEEAGTGWYPSQKVRLFPNNPHIRFENPVHEFVEFSLAKLGIKIAAIDIPVHHYGKLDMKKTLSKGEDYYILGKLKLEQRGEQDPIALFELAMQASELERYDEALGYWKTLTEIKPNLGKPFFGLGNSYYRLGRFDEGYHAVERSIQLEPDSPDIREMTSLYASCALCIGKAEYCIPVLEEALRKNKEYPMGSLMLSMAYFCINDKEKGRRHLEALRNTIITGFNHEKYFYDFANILMTTGKFNYALLLIDAIMETDTTDKRFSELLTKCREMMQAKEGD